ncbi:ATP-dependent Clp protease ATP-binding subunit [Streptomyces oryzae]|uniref:ATP-dependent Clp protease ATP-binding subunit n=1 Tax=Streptomyces oryzae TaxID=1434886 RepID=A0ABS3XG91_9ACTN|nr:ATP-dependent Clp protease ATP-binding subunit [Streptomyces oryzae]MBO8194389.1 ATP-dependent Clp protease ATP-binding subunit [Streptomyces oryzae]
MTTSPFGSPDGADPLSDLLDRFLGTSPSSGASSSSGASPLSEPPTARQVPTGRLLTDSARELLVRAVSRARQDRGTELDTEHLLWAATRTQPTRGLLGRAGADPDRLAAAIAAALPGGSGAPSSEPGLTSAAKRALHDARACSRAAEVSHTGPEHILRALLDDPDSGAGRLLERLGADLGQLRGVAEAAGRREARTLLPGIPEGTPTLDAYGRDLTREVRAAGVDLVVGRAREVEQAVEILARAGKNNPLLIGEPGVGKTAVAEGVAQRIAARHVPAELTGVRLVELDLLGLVAASGDRDAFGELLRRVVDEAGAVAESAPVVLFVADLHTVLGASASAGASAGGGGVLDVGPLLEPALARGELRILGATTLGAYRESAQRNGVLERRFEPVLVAEPGVEETVQLLEGLRGSYEAHHQVRFTREALRAAAELSDRHLTGRCLPDKAVDLMDTAGAQARLRSLGRSTDVIRREDSLVRLRREKEEAAAGGDFDRAAAAERRITAVEAELAAVEERREGVLTVEVGDIAEALSRHTGRPATELAGDEKDRLLRLEDTLRSRIVGQQDAVTAVAEAVRRNRAVPDGPDRPDRPAGSFLFLGPTGAGKSELAKELAQLVFGSEERLIRVAMGELQDPHTLHRLAEQLRHRPYSVVLFDGVEETAHGEGFGRLLEVLDGGGRLTDAQGHAADLRHTLLVITSTVGSQLILAHRGEAEEIRDQLREQLDAHFPPEFLSRLDATVVLRTPTEESLGHIVELLLDAGVRRLRAQNITLEVTPPAERLLTAHGHRSDSAAGALHSTVRTEIDNRLAAFLLGGEVAPGDRLVAEVADDALQLRVERGANGPS